MDEAHEHPDQPDVTSRDNIKKWQSVLEERPENWQTDKIGSEGNYSSWQESIGLSWGETLSIICTYEIFLVFRLYPISTFADSPIIPSLALKVFRVHR